MRTVTRAAVWLFACLFFWVSIILVYPFKHTKLGGKLLGFIDDVDLFAFEIKEEGLREACRSWRRWRNDKRC